MPTSQNTFTTAKILSLGYDELLYYLMPKISSMREYFYAYDVEEDINATGIYDVPTRAMGGALVNLALLKDNSRYDLDWITEEGLGRTNETPLGKPGAYIKRNQIYLVPPTGTGYDTIRKTILLRPGRFIATSAAAQITAINTGTNTLTFASGTIPSTFTTSESFDIIQQNPHFDHLAIDQTASTITSTTIVFSSLPSRLAVGDWVTLAEESPIIQAPVELQPLLEIKTASTILRSQGDSPAMKAMDEEIKKIEEVVFKIFTPRVQKEGKKIVNRTGILRRV